MANYLTTDTDLTAVANAIRTKGGTSSPLSFPSGYVQAIEDIETGSDLSALTLSPAPFNYTYDGKYIAVTSGATTQPRQIILPNLQILQIGDSCRLVMAYGSSPANYSRIERDFVFQGTQTITYNSGAQVTIEADNLTIKRTEAFGWTGAILLKDVGTEGYSSVVARRVETANLTSQNIKKGVTVSVGDVEKDNRILSVTGTYEGIIPQGSQTFTSNGTYDVTNLAEAIVSVSGGGGGSGASKKQINFIDYDGTIVESYTASEWAGVSALPDNPSHDGLVAQGWNWTKAQIDAQLTALPNGDIWIGQMYITQSGDTEIDVSFVDSARLSPIMTIAVNGSITVDWGDNTTPDTVTGTSLTSRKDVPHTYANVGNYTIVIHVTSGYFRFYGSTTYTLLRKNTSSSENRVYSNCIQRIRFGSGVTSIGTSAFSNCYSLASITIPSGVTSIANSAFSNCYALASVTIPSGVTSIGTSALSYCYALASVTIPSGVTSIANSAFSYCYALASVTIPSGVTSIGTSAFNGCYALASITIPSGVTSIANSAFYNCYGIAEYHILPTTVPTLGTNVFQNIVSDCVIYVPRGCLSDYQSATNWSTYASKMQEES